MPSTPGWCWPGCRCKAAISSAPTASTPACGNTWFAVRGVSGFARLQRATAELDYHHQETNFTLGLAELNARLKRRALVILFTDFVDTITAELLIESMQRVANRHLVVFVTQRGSLLQRAVDATPARFADVAQAVIAHDFLRERSIVFERLERLGIHCLDVPSQWPAGCAHQPLSAHQATRADMTHTAVELIDEARSPHGRAGERRASSNSCSKAASFARAARKAGANWKSSCGGSSAAACVR